MKVLILTAHFRPNIGGVETHLDDLVNALIKRNFLVTVLTYRPLTTRVKWKIFEKNHGLIIIRIPWLPNLFYFLLSLPLLEFLYLLPGLFIASPFVLIMKNPDLIHAHGLVAGFVACFWGKLFNKRVIISTHSIYHFPKRGLYRDFVYWIFSQANLVSGLSKQAASEIRGLGLSFSKIKIFPYWVDLDKFKILGPKFQIKEKLGWKDKFIILFVGRLVVEKGIKELLEAASIWDSNINLVIIGSGPLAELIVTQSGKHKKIIFLGAVEQDKLPLYYNGADLLIVPSTSEEGFGRVILEALACGTSVIGAKKGAIPEAMDETVGRFIKVNPANIKNAVEYLYTHPMELKKLARNSREFAERRYAEKNIDPIIQAYSK